RRHRPRRLRDAPQGGARGRRAGRRGLGGAGPRRARGQALRGVPGGSLELVLIDIPEHVGYAAVAVFVGMEASGVPVPGETALIAAAVLASQGKLSIELVIAIAAAAAIVGDNIGYLLGRRFGRRVMERPGRMQDRRLVALERGERLFD